MQFPFLSWLVIIIALWITNFGIWWSFVIIICFVVFCIGCLLYLYTMNREAAIAFKQQLLWKDGTRNIKPGLRKLSALEAELLLSAQGKLDQRLTGSHVIDKSLQEILGYLLRDYVYTWYDRVSCDPELCIHIRDTGQKAVVDIATRMKQVDWIPYLTTQLVDDAASHLRLYRQAFDKTKKRRREAEAKLKPSPSASNKPQTLDKFKSATEQNSNELKSHTRNLSGSGLVPGHSRNNSSSGVSVSSGKGLDVEPTPQAPPPPADELEQTFFDLELAMEQHVLCRDVICMDKDAERRLLQDLVDVLFFLLLPSSDFHCATLRALLRELIVGGVLLPLFNVLTDPDYINLTIIWLCKDFVMTPDAFMLALRITDSLDELEVTREMVNREISLLRSHDLGGSDDVIVKQQLSSLLYVKKVLEARLSRLEAGLDTDSSGVSSDSLLQSGVKLVNLPLDVILKNSVALSIFIDYLASVELEAYVLLYLMAEDWRSSAEAELDRLEDADRRARSLPRGHRQHPARSSGENLREFALNIYHQYLSEKCSQRVKLDEHLTERLAASIIKDEVHPSWFDDILTALHCKLQTHDKCLPGFYRSSSYVRLLSELELLKDGLTEDTDEDSQSLDNLSLSDNTSLVSFDVTESIDTTHHHTGEVTHKSGAGAGPTGTEVPPTCGEGGFTLAAEIIGTDKVQDRGNMYGIYALYVVRSYSNGYKDNWHVYRRYSDFYDLQQKVKNAYSDLGKLTFPGKKTFNNMEKSTLEKRMKMLNDYLQILLQSGVAETHDKLPDMLLGFLEIGEYDKSSGPFAKTFETLVNPLKSSMRTVSQAVRTMPDNLLNTVDGVFDGLTKVFQTRGKQYEDTMRVGAGLQQDTDDIIPLRIMLLLMDEMFDLKSRNQWLRRRIVTLLRQIIRTMFGDIVNKKILDYVSVATGPQQVAVYLNTFKQSMWPNGARAVPPATRDEATRLRTRVMAKTALLSSLSDELKHVIGSDTTRRGLMRVLQMFQYPVLNRRLLYVLLEGILNTSFSQNKLAAIFKTIHSRSPRVAASGKARTQPK